MSEAVIKLKDGGQVHPLATGSKVIFFHATWSGGSHMALRHLQAFARLKGVPDSELIVVDVDTVESMIWPGIDPALGHGWGYAVSVRSGVAANARILGRDHLKRNELVEAFWQKHLEP